MVNGNQFIGKLKGVMILILLTGSMLIGIRRDFVFELLIGIMHQWRGRFVFIRDPRFLDPDNSRNWR